jgi:hypothetical protein
MGQFWTDDHGKGRILYNEYSDGTIEEADIMLPERIIDLQVWDAENGRIFNHLVDQGWQPGTLPHGVDPDAPIPAVLADHETEALSAKQVLKRAEKLRQSSPPKEQPLQGRLDHWNRRNSQGFRLRRFSEETFLRLRSDRQKLGAPVVSVLRRNWA